MIFMDKDEFLLKRIRELANLSYQRDIVTFTDFLNLNEQNMLASLKLHQIGVEVKLFGGYEHAERQMAAFFPGGLGFTWDYPIDCLKIEPKALRFSEELGHRDYLGALLNLGVDRSVVGDIYNFGSVYSVFPSRRKCSGRKRIFYLLYQSVHIPCICNVLSGYAGSAYVYHSGEDEMDGNFLCSDRCI